MPDLKSHNYDEKKEREAVKYYLNKVTEKLKTMIPKESGKKYIPLSERYRAAMQGRENTYEWIRASFNDDVRILIEVISESVVKAIQLEVPFVANVEDIIYRMHDDVKDEKLTMGPFGRFFEKNYEIIEHERFEQSEALREQNEAKRKIHEKINEILMELGA
jgi:GTPase Era involved in 16S rRNA processing